MGLIHYVLIHFVKVKVGPQHVLGYTKGELHKMGVDGQRHDPAA